MARIALVEDDQTVRNALAIRLRRMGHEVEIHENGRYILDHEGEFVPDVVLTDMLMPEADGMQTIRALTRNHPEVRVIAMSGGLSGRDPGALIRWAMMAGADAALAKPFTDNELRAVLGRFLDTPEPETDAKPVTADEIGSVLGTILGTPASETDVESSHPAESADKEGAADAC